MSTGNYIAGKWMPGGGIALESLNPATSEIIWQGNTSTAQDVVAACTAARSAFTEWRKAGLDKRIVYIEAFKKILTENAGEFAALIAEETGKVLWDAKGEVQAMIGKVDLSIRAHRERTGYQHAPGAVAQTLRHRPHGVMAVFGPYNFPGHLPNGHIIPALIAGNTVVFKPSEQTPRVAEFYASLWKKTDTPSGVFNLVQGARETGEALAASTEVDGILFTGSAEVGALLHEQFGGHPGKLLALEMGGNNPLIIHDVADVKAAALIAVQSAFLTTGQRCSCARRLILPEGAEGNAVLEAIVTMAATIRVAAYNETPEGFMGPLISNREADKILAAQAQMEIGGGKPLLKAARLREGLPFLSAAIMDVTKIAVREDREYFGPLLQVIRVKNIDMAISEANATRFGLAAGLVSDNAALYTQFVDEINAGVVNWNRPTNGASSALPFGGVGASGNHRPSAFYAADYCAYPVASQEAEKAVLPDIPPQGITL